MSKGVGEMVRSRSVQVKASAGTEGARRATGVPADGAAGEAGPQAPGQRWSVGRKRDVVLRLLRGESLAALSREVGVEIYRLEDWRDRAVAGLERGIIYVTGQTSRLGLGEGLEGFVPGPCHLNETWDLLVAPDVPGLLTEFDVIAHDLGSFT